ncbi:MAG: minichromosome maintenance protein MCM [Candidatus Altiarchaeota archaeon]|nr:minichromosome maintenance protein MCM [Candidatus Altiarchaeota archaeon]
MAGNIESFLKSKKEDIDKLASKYPLKKSLILDFQEFWSYDKETAEKLRVSPEEVLVEFEDTLNNMGVLTSVEKPKFFVRFRNMPKDPGYTVMVRHINAEHIGKFISVEGVVNRKSEILPKVNNALFVCNKCDGREWVKQDKKFLKEPGFCRQCGRQSEFRFMPEESEWIDVQELEIQEPLELLKGGEQARTIKLWCENDITDVVSPGDKIILTGIVRLQPPKVKGSVFYKFLEVNHLEGVEREFEDIEITPEEESEIINLSKDSKLYDKIVGSIAPSIYGYNEVKEAIALQMFGGRPGKVLPDGTAVRPDIHLLLIGDPGVAKSRMLQFVNQIAPKSIYVTGKGTTGAGLTATAEKSELAEGAWTLKAGALVLAGGGIAAIDEFDKMTEEDRSAMHEAMEQQTISVAKAGIIARFKANTSILAASNPKFSRFDNYKPLAEQFDIPPTLISRFDLIFPLRDILDSEADRAIEKHMLKMHKSVSDMKEIEPKVSPDILRKYIAYARIHVKPVLTEDAADKIENFYVSLRARSSGGTAASTPRQLEALVRLSEASAKMRLSNTVSVVDVERAVKLTEFVLMEIAYDKTTGQLDIDRVITSYPSSTRARIRVIEDILRNLVGSSDSKTAVIDDVLEQAGAQGISKSDIDQVLNDLKNKGVIYEPRHGRFMFTE